MYFNNAQCVSKVPRYQAQAPYASVEGAFWLSLSSPDLNEEVNLRKAGNFQDLTSMACC